MTDETTQQKLVEKRKVEEAELETNLEEEKTKKSKTAETKVEDVKTEDVKTEETKTEETKTEETKTEETKTEETKTEETKVAELEKKIDEEKAEVVDYKVLSDELDKRIFESDLSREVKKQLFRRQEELSGCTWYSVDVYDGVDDKTISLYVVNDRFVMYRPRDSQAYSSQSAYWQFFYKGEPEKFFCLKSNVVDLVEFDELRDFRKDDLKKFLQDIKKRCSVYRFSFPENNPTLMAFNLWILFQGKNNCCGMFPPPKRIDVTKYRKWYDAGKGSFNDVIGTIY